MDDESYAVIEAILGDDEQSRRLNFTPATKSDDHQWQTVRRRRRNPADESPSGEILETVEEARAVAVHNSAAKLSDGKDEEAGNGGAVEAEERPEAKPMEVTVGDVAGKIDASDLAAFLADITISYANQENVLLMRFVDYFGRVFASISAAEFHG